MIRLEATPVQGCSARGARPRRQATRQQDDRQLLLFGQHPPAFNGRTYRPAQDKDRLSSSLARVVALMSDGRPRTIPQIASAVGCSETSASARLRDLRKERYRIKFDVVDVIAGRVAAGLWTYTVKIRRPERKSCY